MDLDLSSHVTTQFLKLCELDQHQIGSHSIHHDLNRWGLSIYDTKLVDGDSSIELQINVPYTEMELSFEEKMNDNLFFNKNVLWVSVVQKKEQTGYWSDYIWGSTNKALFSKDIDYLLLRTPLFYPHNWYYGTNKSYLAEKLFQSIHFLRLFLNGYKNAFNYIAPIMHIIETRESRDEYEIDIITKEYINISHAKTDVDSSTIYFVLIVDLSKRTDTQQNRIAGYHKITVKVPRKIRKGTFLNIRFLGNQIEN